MVTVAPPRRLESKTKEPQKPPSPTNPRMLEGLAVLLFGVAVFLVVAFVTYHPLDPSLNRVASKTWQFKNSAGIAGSFVGDAVGQVLGAAGLIFPLGMLLVGIRWIRGRRVESPWALGAGLFLGMLVAAVSLQDFAGRADPLFGHRIPAGGLLGGFLRPHLFQFFGGVGGYLILVVAGVFAVLQIASLRVSDFLKASSKLVRLIAVSLRVCVVFFFRGGRRLLAGLWRALVKSASALRPGRIEWAAIFGRLRITKVTGPEPEVPSEEDVESPLVPLRLDSPSIGAMVPGRDSVKAAPVEIERGLEEVSGDSGPERSSSTPAPLIEIAAPIERARQKNHR